VRCQAEGRQSRSALIATVRRTLEAYERRDQHWLLIASHAEDDRVRIPPFDAIELEMGLLWA